MSALPIRSPLPGIFYRRPSPEAAPFKEDGAAVAVTDVVGLIEVMKSFHEVAAGVAGASITFLIDNEEPVMAGQVIAEVLP
jgi:acetyl-CoA carboxylase biotin carboxyl carrier protein